jgi:MFS transporter, BCD family, chlorophyll transporter
MVSQINNEGLCMMFGWFEIIRVGLIQASLGAVVVLTTSMLNRIMIVEMALPALLPGVLIALHYAVQIVRPRMGYGADLGSRRTPWIMAGILILAVGGVLAAVGTAVAGTYQLVGIGIALIAFMLIGVGVSACGTSLLTLLAVHVPQNKRAAAAAIVWMMMIVGFICTTAIAGSVLDPFSIPRLVAVSSGVSLISILFTCIALWKLEPFNHNKHVLSTSQRIQFRDALVEIWADATARRFTIFVFLSMLAYSAQDLVLEPFAGAVLGYTPGASTKLSAVQHGGVLVGMVLVAVAASLRNLARYISLRIWITGGCAVSAAALLGLSAVSLTGSQELVKPLVFLLGLSNGAFSIAAIGSMMSLSVEGAARRPGTRMGLWGAAQAVAFACGGILGTGISDLARYFLPNLPSAYAMVFLAESLLFVLAALMAVFTWSRDRELPNRPTSLQLTVALESMGGK